MALQKIIHRQISEALINSFFGWLMLAMIYLFFAFPLIRLLNKDVANKIGIYGIVCAGIPAALLINFLPLYRSYHPL